MSQVCRLAFILSMTASLVRGSVNDTRISYDGYSVWKAIPNDPDGFQYLLNLYINGSSYLKLDFWHPPSKIGQQVDVMVDSGSLPTFKFECKLKNIELTPMVENVQKLIDAEKGPKSSNLRFRPQMDSQSFDFSRYPKIEEIQTYLAGLPQKYPNLVEWHYLTATHEKRQVFLMKITNKFTNNLNKPAVWIDAGIHAREWIAPITALYMINQLLTNYNIDQAIKNYVDNMVWYIVPVLNPDGYAHTHSKDRMWRKNKRPQTCTGTYWKNCCEGVDLNRNFGYHWAESGSSPNPCTEVYHGPSAFSEPESKGVRDFILRNGSNIRAYLTLHSYSLMWIYPYGYRSYTYTSDKADLVNLAKKATAALQKEYGTIYTIGSAPDILYAAAGGSDDWAKGSANIKYVYTIELRPGDAGYNNGFILHPSQILPTGEETWKAFRVIADEVLLNYPSRRF